MRTISTTFSGALSTPLEIPGAASRITAMEGMRGYAVLLVFLVHYHTLFAPLLPRPSLLYRLSESGHNIGNTGVDLFFVLSGFLIYGHVFQKAPSYVSYLRKRIRRIYPAFFCVFCFHLLASFLVPSVSKLPHSAFNGFVYIVQNLLFLPGIFPIEPLITVAWSLSYEFFFYISIPLLIGATGMRRWRRPFRIAFFLGLLLVHCTGCYFGVLPHIRLIMFIGGILLFDVTEAGWTKGRLSTPGELLAIGVYLAALLMPALFRLSADPTDFQLHFLGRSSVYWTTFLCVGLFPLTLYTIGFAGLLQSFFCLAPLRWLGNMSYTYFLCHGSVLYGVQLVLRRVLPPHWQSPLAFLALLILNLALTLAVSLVRFLLVEKPFSLTVRRTSASGAVPPAPDLQGTGSDGLRSSVPANTLLRGRANKSDPLHRQRM